MIFILVLLIIGTAYFSCMSRIYAVLDQSTLINDLKEEKKRILFSFLKEMVSGDTFFFYVSMMLSYLIFLISATFVLFTVLQGSLVIHSMPVFTGLVVLIAFAAVYAGGEILAQVLVKIRAIHKFQGTYFFALLFYLAFYPLLQILFSFWSFILTRGFKRNISHINVEFISGHNLDMLLNASTTGKTQNKNSQELKILQNALLFSNTRIRDCMIPRTEVESLEIGTSIEEAKSKFVDTGYSKLIVYQDNIDNIIGYFSSKEIFKRPANIGEKLSPITFVPETMPANRLLHEFMHDNRSIAVVVDEYGGTSGIVTLEDIMEEIFGDIEDEHDTDDLVERKVRNGEFVFSGRLEIEYLNSRYNLQIPESEDYDTLAGFIIYHHKNLPKVNDIVKIDLFSIKILKASNTRIDLVMLRIGE